MTDVEEWFLDRFLFGMFAVAVLGCVVIPVYLTAQDVGGYVNAVIILGSGLAVVLALGEVSIRLHDRRMEP